MVAFCAESAAPPQDDGLVGLWQFEEGSGTAVKDSSTHHNDGTIIGTGVGAPVWGTGEFAGSLSFTGADGNHVRIPASPSLNQLTKHLTVVAHVRPRTLWAPRPFWAFWRDKPTGTGFIAVVQRQWQTTNHPDLFYLGFGPNKDALAYKWHLGLVTPQNRGVSLYCLPASREGPVAGQWMQLAGTYDSDAGKMVLYVDGTPICSRAGTGAIRLDAESLDRPLIIGGELNVADINATSNEFDGYIDEVRIYNRALSAVEIKALADEWKKRGTR